VRRRRSVGPVRADLLLLGEIELAAEDSVYELANSPQRSVIMPTAPSVRSHAAVNTRTNMVVRWPALPTHERTEAALAQRWLPVWGLAA